MILLHKSALTDDVFLAWFGLNFLLLSRVKLIITEKTKRVGRYNQVLSSGVTLPPANDGCNACLRSLSRDSSMASRQNTMTEPQESQDAPPTENNTTNCTNSQAVNSTATNKQDKAMEQQACKQSNAATAASRISTSPPESLDPALDPSSLPPPDPSLGTGNCSAQGDGVQSSTPACLRDGNWFLKLLQAETARMEGWCQQMEQETKDNTLSEEGE